MPLITLILLAVASALGISVYVLKQDPDNDSVITLVILASALSTGLGIYVFHVLYRLAS